MWSTCYIAIHGFKPFFGTFVSIVAQVWDQEDLQRLQATLASIRCESYGDKGAVHQEKLLRWALGLVKWSAPGLYMVILHFLVSYKQAPDRLIHFRAHLRRKAPGKDEVMSGYGWYLLGAFEFKGLSIFQHFSNLKKKREIHDSQIRSFSTSVPDTQGSFLKPWGSNGEPHQSVLCSASMWRRSGAGDPQWWRMLGPGFDASSLDSLKSMAYSFGLKRRWGCGDFMGEWPHWAVL